MKRFLLLLFIFTIALPSVCLAQDLELLDEEDAELLKEFEETSKKESADDPEEVNLTDIEERDDLESLRQDVGELIFEEDLNKGSLTKRLDESKKKKEEPIGKATVANKGVVEKKDDKSIIFDVGSEEKELLALSKFVEGKIPEKEWNEIAVKTKAEKYVVQEGDWLWKISQKLFGSGFYYAKIWSLNPHITNPHEIVPGMVLVFDTGSEDAIPSVTLGEFTEGGKGKGRMDGDEHFFDFTQFGSSTEPKWLRERRRLINQGVFFQYASDETYADLAHIGKKALNFEYKKYEPPQADIIITEPGDQYDDSGFDRDSKIVFDFREGFFLNSFVTSNVVQDLGFIDAAKKENMFISTMDKIYIEFDDGDGVKPGDMFSIYRQEGKVSHEISDREGYRYTILAQIRALRPINHLWECMVTESTGLVERKDRITVYTPKINSITKTFTKRNIEAAIIGTYKASDFGIAFGDVVYLDRGRADGVEMGTVFEVYDFYDRGTLRRITPDPTYKVGEITVITLTDNFATGLVSLSESDFKTGMLMVSKTIEKAALTQRVREGEILHEIKDLQEEALDELDVELNLDDISLDLLEKVDRIQLTEDELEELERQEREKSIIGEHERDLKELERLEAELEALDAKLNESKVDEDKFLEETDLDNIEGTKEPGADAFESMDEVESDMGAKYLEEDMNNKENPYGLTEFDLEEIDELLNTESE